MFNKILLILSIFSLSLFVAPQKAHADKAKEVLEQREKGKQKSKTLLILLC